MHTRSLNRTVRIWALMYTCISQHAAQEATSTLQTQAVQIDLLGHDGAHVEQICRSRCSVQRGRPGRTPAVTRLRTCTLSQPAAQEATSTILQRHGSGRSTSAGHHGAHVEPMVGLRCSAQRGRRVQGAHLPASAAPARAHNNVTS
jgi:hypothetical protein